jgi:tripartite-type tricarboxylate transporter receptor subunit TctC
MRKMIRLICAALIGVTVLPMAAWSQTWPDRPVRVIVPYPAGGSTDNAARVFGEQLSQRLGQTVVIDNKGGAGGAIGVEAAAKSAPDGYTFVVLPMATVTVLPHARVTPYDPFKDFAYVGRFVFGTLTFAVSPDFPATDIKSFIAAVKAKPGAYNAGSSGIGAMPHLAVEVFRELAGVDLVVVHYRGGADAIKDFLGGRVQTVHESNVMPLAKAGKARMLAVIDSERHPDFPDVPTLAESLPGYDVTNWFGLAAPAGTPPAVVARMSALLNEIAVLPDVRTKLLPLGLRPVTDTPAAMEADVRKGHARYGELVRRLNIRME